MNQKPVEPRAAKSRASAASTAELPPDLARLVAAADWVIGSDEAGYGTLAGDLVVCAVAVPRGWHDSKVDDSKALSERARIEVVRKHRASKEVMRSLHTTPPEEIDSRGVWASLISSHNRVHEALEAKLRAVQPGVTLVHIADGLENAHLHLDARIHPVAKADTFIPAVSLASCFAKVVQCELMNRAADLYPGYGFEQHHGYDTRGHRKALESLGVVAIHRRSFSPIRKLIDDGAPTHRGGRPGGSEVPDPRPPGSHLRSGQ